MQRNTFVRVCALLSITLMVQLYPTGGARCDEAKAMYEKGVTLFGESQFIEASKAFREAYALRPAWRLYFNIGQCEASAKRYGLAMEAFEAYLVGGGDDVQDDRRAYVTDEIERMRPLVGSLEITGDDGLTVLVDGEQRAVTPLEGPLRVEAGRHTLVLKKETATILEKSIQVAGGMATSVNASVPTEATAPLVTTPEPPSPTETSTAPEEAPAPRAEPVKPKSKVLGFAVMGVGLAVGVAGGVTGGLALGKHKDLEKACPEKEACPTSNKKLKDKGDNLALATNILLPVGGVVAAAGVVLTILAFRSDNEAPRASLSPAMGRDGAGLILTGRF